MFSKESGPLKQPEDRASQVFLFGPEEGKLAKRKREDDQRDLVDRDNKRDVDQNFDPQRRFTGNSNQVKDRRPAHGNHHPRQRKNETNQEQIPIAGNTPSIF